MYFILSHRGNETDNLAHEENLTRPALTPLLPAAPMFPVTSSPGLNRNGDFSAALISAVSTVFDSTPSGKNTPKLIN